METGWHHFLSHSWNSWSGEDHLGCWLIGVLCGLYGSDIRVSVHAGWWWSTVIQLNGRIVGVMWCLILCGIRTIYSPLDLLHEVFWCTVDFFLFGLIFTNLPLFSFTFYLCICGAVGCLLKIVLRYIHFFLYVVIVWSHLIIWMVIYITITILAYRIPTSAPDV